MNADKGSRCPKCFWALYDGRTCQNNACGRFGKRIANPIYLTNEEAFQMINEKQSAEQSTSTIVLRVTPSRKAAYVRAAHPRTLSAWMFEQCDKAATMKDEQAKHAAEFAERTKQMCAYLERQDFRKP